MARGGKRQGTPGVGYSNRTDLAQNRMPASAAATPASGGVTAPTLGQQQPPQLHIDPNEIPKLDDPTHRPNEPVTSGLMSGAGPGPEAIGPVPPDPVVQELEAAYLVMQTPELARVISRFKARGVL